MPADEQLTKTMRKRAWLIRHFEALRVNMVYTASYKDYFWNKIPDVQMNIAGQEGRTKIE